MSEVENRYNAGFRKFDAHFYFCLCECDAADWKVWFNTKGSKELSPSYGLPVLLLIIYAAYLFCS